MKPIDRKTPPDDEHDHDQCERGSRRETRGRAVRPIPDTPAAVMSTVPEPNLCKIAVVKRLDGDVADEIAIMSMPVWRGLQPNPFWNIRARRKGADLIRHPEERATQARRSEPSLCSSTSKIQQRMWPVPLQVDDRPPDQHRP